MIEGDVLSTPVCGPCMGDRTLPATHPRAASLTGTKDRQSIGLTILAVAVCGSV